MKFLLRNLLCFGVIALYVLCILAANPRGEFPLNDDWSYVRSAFSFGSGQGFKVDEWVAPSLVGQALYGGLLVKFFSPSFLVLRLSTLVLSCLTAVLLWAVFVRIGFRNNLSCVMLLSWVFNPLQFYLSFTFMTEIPFLFFAVLAIYLYALHLDNRKSLLLVLSSASFGYAFLIRQTALFFVLALICSVLMDSQKSLRQRIQQCVLATVTASIFIIGYFALIVRRGGSTAAVHRKFDLLHDLTAKQIIGNSYGMLFYLAFMLLPVLFFLIPSLYRMAGTLSRKIQICVLIVWSAFIAAGLWWFPAHWSHSEYLPSTAFHARMPFLLNVLYDTGLGPITLDPDYFGAPPTPIYPRAWIVVTAIVAAGTICFGLLCIFGIIRLRRLRMFREKRPMFVLSSLTLLGLVPFEIVFSHLQEGGLFDRHILIAALPFGIVLGLLASEYAQKERNRKAGIPVLSAAGIAIAALGVFSVAATHDYMEWNRIRWDMGRSLLERGVSPLSIAGGFEFNAWHNYDTFLARGNIANTNKWWYDRRDYVITMIPQKGYEVMQKKEYFSWVHRRPIALYLIRDSKLKKPRVPIYTNSPAVKSRISNLKLGSGEIAHK